MQKSYPWKTLQRQGYKKGFKILQTLTKFNFISPKQPCMSPSCGTKTKITNHLINKMANQQQQIKLWDHDHFLENENN